MVFRPILKRRDFKRGKKIQKRLQNAAKTPARLWRNTACGYVNVSSAPRLFKWGCFKTLVLLSTPAYTAVCGKKKLFNYKSENRLNCVTVSGQYSHLCAAAGTSVDSVTAARRYRGICVGCGGSTNAADALAISSSLDALRDNGNTRSSAYREREGQRKGEERGRGE